MLQAIQAFDAQLLLFLQAQLHSGGLTALMRAITALGNGGALWLVLAALLLLRRKTRRGAVFLVLCLLCATVVGSVVLKHLVLRPRPYTVLEQLILLIPPEHTTSFPSGHSCSSVASAMALALVFGKRGAWAFLPAGLIAFSRLYVGVHYPTDVLCGAALGAVTALALYRLLWPRLAGAGNNNAKNTAA